MASLPTIPAGSNPFEIYLNTLHLELFPTVPDAKTFAVRVWALVGVCAYGVLISLIYGVSLLLQRRRRSSLWVARKVDGYLTLNLNFFVPFGGAISCLSMLAYTVLQFNIFTLSPPSSSRLYAVNTFRTFSWVPLVLHGYSVAASAAQASLIVSSRARQTTTTEVEKQGGRYSLWRWMLRTPNPRIANATFWVGLVALSLALFIPDILFSISWRRAYSCIGALEKHLSRQAAAWSPTDGANVTLPALMKTSELYGNLEEEVGHNRNYQRAVVYALILTPLFLAFTTLLASVLLHSLLRLQIRTRSARALAQSTLLADVHTFASPVASPKLEQGRPQQPMRFEVAFPSARRHSVLPGGGGIDVGMDDLYEDDEEDERDSDVDYPVPHKIVAIKPAQPRPLSPLPSTPSSASKEDIESTEDRTSSPPPFDDFLPALPSFPPAALTPSSSPPTSRRPSVVFHAPFSRSSRRNSAFAFAGDVEGGWKKRHGSLGTLEHACLAVKRAREAAAKDEELGELRRAERELGICAAVVLLLTLSLGIENIWNVVRVVPASFVDLNWTEIETSYFLPPFLYVTTYSTAITLLLLFNSLLTPSCPSPSPSHTGSTSSSDVDAEGYGEARRPSLAIAQGARRTSRLGLFLTGGERTRASASDESAEKARAREGRGARTVVALGLGLRKGADESV
ncbi:hypothetical protein JCM11251_001959 [Rhodosporidiobolus azoricus]